MDFLTKQQTQESVLGFTQPFHEIIAHYDIIKLLNTYLISISSVSNMIFHQLKKNQQKLLFIHQRISLNLVLIKVFDLIIIFFNFQMPQSLLLLFMMRMNLTNSITKLLKVRDSELTNLPWFEITTEPEV